MTLGEEKLLKFKASGTVGWSQCLINSSPFMHFTRIANFIQSVDIHKLSQIIRNSCYAIHLYLITFFVVIGYHENVPQTKCKNSQSYFIRHAL